jgi:hypothetical protein
MDPKILFRGTVTDAEIQASQPDADHLEITIAIGDRPNVARLPAHAAVALAASILVAFPGHAMHHAEQLSDETRAVLGLAFLYPAARDSLERASTGPSGKAS